MMRAVATLAALVGGANAQGFTCGADFTLDCTTLEYPGPVTDASTPCGCGGYECSGTPTDCEGADDQATCTGVAGCTWGPSSLSRACGAADAETCCLPKTCASTGWDDSSCTGIWVAGGAAKSDAECSSEDGTCTVEDCCTAAATTPTDCAGSWDVCDATTCAEADDRQWIETVAPANGGRACPAAGSAPNCFDEAATDAYDGSCEDTCDPSLCAAGTKPAPWATADACTAASIFNTDINCDGTDEDTCTAVDGCTWTPKPDCDGACTAAECCVPNECRVPAWTTDGDEANRKLRLGTAGYFADDPDATTVSGLGFVGCSTGVKKPTTIQETGSDPPVYGSEGGFVGRPYNVDVTCPVDGQDFQWAGCTEAADCDGAAELVAAPATCTAKGNPPTCTQDDAAGPVSCEVDANAPGTCIATCTAVAADCASIGDTVAGGTGCTYQPNDTAETGRLLDADKEACGLIKGAALADASACENVMTGGPSAEGWEAGTCGTDGDGNSIACRSYQEATCTLPDDAQPTDDVCQPTSPCQLTPDGDCPTGCLYTPASGAACDYTPEVKSDKINMQALGDHVVDTTGDTSCARLDPEGKLTHFESCEVTCEDGWHLEESKRDDHKIRITNPKYWRPLHPVCDDGILHYSVKCVENTDWLGVLIIVLVLGFFLVLIPVVKYMRVVASYNQDKAAGCTWAPDGTKADPTAASDEAAD